MAPKADSCVTLFGAGGGPVTSSKVVHFILRCAALCAKKRKASPGPLNIVSINTAKDKVATFYEHFVWLNKFFAGPNFKLSLLHEFNEQPKRRDVEKKLAEADLIVFPGGDTELASELLEKWGLARPIRRAVERGVVVFGHSAGLLIWFGAAQTDAESYKNEKRGAKDDPFNYKVIRTLGVLKTSAVCAPHSSDNAQEWTKMDYSAGNTRGDVHADWIRCTGAPGLNVPADTAIYTNDDVVTVLGTDQVSTYRWDKDQLITDHFKSGERFSLSTLERL